MRYGKGALAPDDPRAAWAVFTVSEAARYLGITPPTLAAWIDPPTENKPLIFSAFEKRGHQPRLSFLNFAEAYVIYSARKAGLSMPHVRKGVDAVRRDLGVDYALATKRLYLSKTDLLVAPEGGLDMSDPADVERAHDRQIQMTGLIKEELKHITYGTDGIAQTVELPAFRKTGITVTVDPYVAFGAPIIPRTGTRVRDIVALRRAGERIEDIASNFSLSDVEVGAVLRAAKEPAAA